MRAIGSHDPERALVAIQDLVHPAPRINYLRSVRRELRIGDPFEIEVMLDGEQRIGRFLLRDDRAARRAGNNQESGQQRAADKGGADHRILQLPSDV